MKREKEIKTWEAKCHELKDKNDKLVKQVREKFHVQGAKNIIWDALISEATKLRPCLDYILEKEIMIQSSKQSVTAVKERLKKNPIDYVKNTIDFLNGLTEDALKEANSKDIICIITWVRNVVNKHQHLDTVEENIGIMAHQVKLFMDMFDPLFIKGLPFFWEDKGSMLSKKEYHDYLIECRSYHTKFADMQQSLSGKKILDKLADDFEMIFSFKSTCAHLPDFSYRAHVELQVLTK